MKQYFKGFAYRFFRVGVVQVIELAVVFIIANLLGEILFTYLGHEITQFMSHGDDKYSLLEEYGKEMKFIALVHIFIISTYVVTNLIELVDRFFYLFFNKSKHIRRKSL